MSAAFDQLLTLAGQIATNAANLVEAAENNRLFMFTPANGGPNSNGMVTLTIQGQQLVVASRAKIEADGLQGIQGEKGDKGDQGDQGPAGNINNAPASAITSGVFDIARIPVLPSQLQFTSSGGLADLTTAQQNAIGQGSIVTTTDGYRWVYNGSGSKTVAGSYTQLADITPEWDIIANKPSTFPSTIAQVSDLTTALNGKSAVGHTHGLADIPVQLYRSGGTGQVDWNSTVSTQNGFGGLLQANATNGPIPGNGSYYHPWNVVYSTTSNMCQLALPYGDSSSVNAGLHYRGRYDGAWTPWQKIWTSTTFDPATKLGVTAKAADSDLLDGMNPASGSSANTIVSRDSNGDFGGRYVNSAYFNSTDNVVGSGVTSIMVKAGDDYHRSGNQAAVRTFLGLGTAAYSATGTFAAASHGHSISEVSGLQTALDGKASLTSPTFSGTITAATVTSGNHTFSTGRSGNVGVYDAAQTQAVWAMGPAYVLSPSGNSTTYGNHYGLAWSYNPDYGANGNNPQSKVGLNHQLLIQNAGVTQTAIGSGVWTNGFIESAGSGGWAIGSKGGVNRIDFTGGGFRALNAAGSYAGFSASDISASGNLNVSGSISSGSISSSGSITAAGWLYSGGSTGWYNNTYAGGIHMSDSTWIRTYNGKSFYCDAEIQATTLRSNAATYTVSLTASGAIQGATVTATSDASLKENIVCLDGALELVSRIKARRFNWIEDGRADLGVIAQELEEVLPELVYENEGKKSVNYGALSVVNTAAIQEQEVRIARLEAQVAALMGRLN